MKKNNNALAIVMPNLFGELNFSSLNDTLEALGKASGKITDEEKKEAVKVIDEWQTNVIERLRLRQQEANCLLNTLNPNDGSFFMDTDQIEAMVAAAGVDALYQAYLDKRDAYDMIQEPQREPAALNMTIEEQIDATNRDIAAQHKYRVCQQRAAYELGIALRALKSALSSNEKVKELVARVTKFKRNVRRFELDCSEKSQLAKISIAISSEEAREALKQLINFDIGV